MQLRGWAYMAKVDPRQAGGEAWPGWGGVAGGPKWLVYI